MTISLDGKIYRVESCVKVTVAKGNAVHQRQIKNLINEDTIEKNFKLGQPISRSCLSERKARIPISRRKRLSLPRCRQPGASA
jgi:elongation factor P